ncbi:hypothetical protein D3C87_2087250 [compost metagenome]
MMNTAAIMVRDSGTSTSMKNLTGPAPSIRAASSNSSGTDLKNWRKKKVPVAEASSGRIRPVWVFKSPRSLITL